MENSLVHIAIIPDGNRRWAKERGLPAFQGHRKGAENFEELLNTVKELKIPYLTAWLFSTENWKRSKDESDYLFDMGREFISKYREKFLKEKTRYKYIGRKDRIPEDLAKSLSDLENETKDFKGFTVSIALDYGGHDELLRTFEKVKSQNLPITQENIENNLDTAGMPAPDLIIRTSGEQRLSGFMLWQSAYAELIFPKVYFPDFNSEELKKAINEYYQRQRRFGGN